MMPFTATMGTMGIAYYSMFLTDYAGIDSAMGIPGFAAGFATIFLVLTRIIDAIDDPLQGWILDSAKERKFGKYRMYGMIGTVLVTVGVIMLFGLPQFTKGNAIMLWIWVVVGYVILETGSAMSTVSAPLMQKISTNPIVRSRLAASNRLGQVIAAIPFLFYVTIVTLIGNATGDLSSAATTSTIIFCLIFCGVTFLGLMLTKEPYRENLTAAHEKKISIREIVDLLKTNRPLWIHCIGVFIGGFATGASPLYFLRWKFCADVTTGAVDLTLFATYSGIISVLTLIPNFVCPILFTPMMKIFKSPDKCIRVCYAIIAAVFATIFGLNALNLLTPILLFTLVFIAGVPGGMCTILTSMMVTECADYAEYNLGRNMTAIVSSVYNFTVKASSVIGTALPGILLAMVGYSVDEQTGAYIGAIENLPKMIDGLAILLGPVPFTFAIVAFLVYRFGYKITPEYREKMVSALEARHKGEKEVENAAD